MLDTSKLAKLECYVCKQHIGYVYFNRPMAIDENTVINRVINLRDNFKAFFLYAITAMN